MKNDFQKIMIGDRVEVHGECCGVVFKGETGTVVCDAIGSSIGIEFDELNSLFHDCGGDAAQLRGFFIPRDMVSRLLILPHYRQYSSEDASPELLSYLETFKII